MKTLTQYLRYCWLINAVLLLGMCGAVFLYPVFFTLRNLGDPALREPGTPRAAVSLHHQLSPRMATWARERIDSKAAADLTTKDLVETEWPVFGAMFYLWATEALQESWEKDKSISAEEPKVYARGAIDAATDLILDPNHAKWVRDHWGEDYLHTQNIFYRGLLVSAITVHAKLTGDTNRLGLLREYVDELAKDIEESPAGLLDDYPAECYPGDVLMAIAAIKRSDAVLGTDHSAFVKRSLRGFTGVALTEEGIPPYMAYPATAIPEGCARGCANSYICMNAPELWPEEAAQWYANHEKHFWQSRMGIHGFREYPHHVKEFDYHIGDMDAGPTFLGFGMAAAAFGVSAAKANGRYDHAYELMTQMLAGAWVLPDGTMLIPRLLSSAVHAPHLGESCIIYNLAIQPHTDVEIKKGGSLPGFVWILLGLYLTGFTVFAAGAASLIWRFWKHEDYITLWPEIQMVVWAVVLMLALVCLLSANYQIGFVFFFAAIALPISRTRKHLEKKGKRGLHLPPYCGLVS